MECKDRLTCNHFTTWTFSSGRSTPTSTYKTQLLTEPSEGICKPASLEPTSQMHSVAKPASDPNVCSADVKMVGLSYWSARRVFRSTFSLYQFNSPSWRTLPSSLFQIVSLSHHPVSPRPRLPLGALTEPTRSVDDFSRFKLVSNGSVVPEGKVKSLESWPADTPADQLIAELETKGVLWVKGVMPRDFVLDARRKSVSASYSVVKTRKNSPTDGSRTHLPVESSEPELC